MTFPGEVVLNADRLVHIVPRISGVVHYHKTFALIERLTDGKPASLTEDQKEKLK